MPVKCGQDSKGCYCQWGDQKKYYYSCGSKSGKASAAAKAGAQGAAIRRSGYKDGLYFAERAVKEMLADETLKPEDLREEHKYLLKSNLNKPN